MNPGNHNERIGAMFQGKQTNATEQRAVLCTLPTLRDDNSSNKQIRRFRSSRINENGY